MLEMMHGDCLVEMDKIADGSVDMILCDLPYGTTACKWDTVIPFEPLWKHYKRIIKKNGAIVLTASQPFTSLLIASNFDWFKYCWVWVKSRSTGFQHAKNAPLKRHEDVLVFSLGVINHPSMTKRRMAYYPQIRNGEPYRKFHKTPNVGKGAMHRASAVNLQYVGTTTVNNGTRYPDTVLNFPWGNHGLSHANEKPVALMEYLIRTYTNEGETVLDNCFGSGTTGVACVNLNRNFIGIEKDAEYFSVGKARIEQAQQSKAELLPL